MNQPKLPDFMKPYSIKRIKHVFVISKNEMPWYTITTCRTWESLFIWFARMEMWDGRKTF